MQVVVTYESRTGNTARAADMIGALLTQAGVGVSVDSIADVDYGALARADLVIIGTWTGGLFLFGQHPGGATKIASTLPDLWDKPTYAYVTYAHNAGPAAKKLGEVVEGMGAVNLGTAELHRDHLDTEVKRFVQGILSDVTS